MNIIQVMKNEASDPTTESLSARKITDGEWITVAYDYRNGTYTWYHDTWDVDKPHVFGEAGIQRSSITEEKAGVFLSDAKE